ncbi:MAG: hypothetical protein ABL911_09995 [Gallionella sp.]
MPQVFISLIFVLLSGLASPIAYAENYELGQGWRSGNFYLSGYTNLELIDRFGSPAKLDIDDFSVFASGNINQWVNPFAEIELSKHTLIQQGGNAQNGDLIIERFYNDVIFSEKDTLRVGKLLAPLGEWNITHAAPLMPIVTRPYTAARGFSAYIGGVSWQHESSGEIPSWQLYWQPDNEWFKRPASQTSRNFHNVIGGHISRAYGIKDQMGASFQYGTLIERNETYALLGLNASHSFGKLNLQSEAIISRFSGSIAKAHDLESGIFVLADYAITPQWHGIIEGEYYQDHTVVAASRSMLLAVNYKPDSVPFVWKLEYIHQAGVPSPIATIHTGLKGSLSFLF